MQALGKPLMGPGAEDTAWVPWAQEFLEAARKIAESEIQKGKQTFNPADEDSAVLIYSAARLRAAVFGDTKFAKTNDSAWVSETAAGVAQDYGALVAREPPRELDLAGVPVGDYGLTVICMDLKAGLQLSRLNLSRSAITRDGVETICETLTESHERHHVDAESVVLEKLTLNRCDIGCDSADAIVAGEGKYGRLGPQGREDALGRSMRGVEAIGARF